MKYLSEIPDPRDGRGVRHPVMSILSVVILGLICGYTTVEHIMAFARSHWDELSEALEFRKYYCPDPTTVNRLLGKIDREALENAFEAWVSELVQSDELTASVDGKASRGVVGSTEMMVNVFAQEVRLTLAQWPLQKKQGEPTVLRKQLSGLFAQYPGLRILTGDACYAGRDLCQAIVDLGRDYLVRIKGNQAEIEEALEETFNKQSRQRLADATTGPEKKGAPLLLVNYG